MLTDIPSPAIWVIDPATDSDQKVRGMPQAYLDVVRSVPGVKWAVPIGYTNIPLTTPSGIFQICQLWGIDDATFIGAPREMIEGSILDLRRSGGIIVDVYSANGILAKTLPDGTKIPIKLGDVLEINDHRAVVVGICNITQQFYPQPIIYTSYSEFLRFNPAMANQLAFIGAQAEPGKDVQEVCDRINKHSGILALTKEQFQKRIVDAFLKTGILINFGLSVGLGIIIGFSIAGQIFYIMTLQNLMYYALIKSLGGTKTMITGMIFSQAFLVGFIGFVLGIGATIIWGMAVKNTTLAFLFPWQLLLFTGVIIMFICSFTAALSIRKIFSVDPKVLMGN